MYNYELRNWTKDSYTPNQFEDLVSVGPTSKGVILSVIVISNTTGTNIAVELVITDENDVKLFTLLPSKIIDGTEPPQTLDVRSVPLIANQKLRCKAAASGIEFLAGGNERLD